MKTVNVREAQHNLAALLQEVQCGQIVEIARCKVPVARLVPIRTGEGGDSAVDWQGHAKRLAEIWGSTSVQGVDAVLHDLRNGE